ncbi:MAG: phenylalanine--tRNA ligase subunit beta [Gammaproteobacteria bacterium]|nr:phenylalanine--tRNA ligase subunit beta [Gammaproteobacteria bacterium]
MKFSEKWLRAWVNPDITTQVLAEQLTMAGLEVEAIAPVAAALNKVVVGKVTMLESHPNADKLKLCRVDIGKPQLVNIVCGASNVELNECYPVACVGAVLPGNLKIKKSKLRGVESAGMLCSAKELGMAQQADGLFTLPGDAPVGTPIKDYFKLDDVSIELGLTPNRGDCLSVSGVAREVAALNKMEVTPCKVVTISPKCDDTLMIDVDARKECPRYVGRIIRNVNAQASSPLWLQERLRRSGLRSLGAVIDITNYVLLELGQPMHAFDTDKLHKGIKVRLAKQGEVITLLDGQEIKLNAGALVIADHQQPQALAGIMGGLGSAVSDDTRHLFLESAYFDPACIAGRARSYGLHTDSSHRFERGVDPALQSKAMERATQLLLDIVGGEPGPIVDMQQQEYLPQRPLITLRHQRIQTVLGLTIDRNAISDILKRLRMDVIDTKSGWEITAPSFRFDIECEEDLIEEVARLHGYDKIPSIQPASAIAMVEQSERKISLQRIQDLLLDRGYQEAITYSFVDPNVQGLIKGQKNAIRLANPISADMSEMRTSLWTGLITAAAYNLNRQQSGVKLFETGLCFYSCATDNENLIQEPMLAGAVCGTVVPVQWGVPDRELDFFDIKADVESILALSTKIDNFSFIAEKNPALHPGQSAKIVVKTQLNQNDADNTSEEIEHIGWIGALHPTIEHELDLSQRVYLFELKLSAITARRIPQFVEIPKYPSIKRDLAIVVDEHINAQEVGECIKNTSPTILKNLKLFDVYMGKGIDSGRKSLAYSLTLQDHERTLTDQDVDVAVGEILSELNKKLGATLRN